MPTLNDANAKTIACPACGVEIPLLALDGKLVARHACNNIPERDVYETDAPETTAAEPTAAEPPVVEKAGRPRAAAPKE
jgi:hypothetical protein